MWYFILMTFSGLAAITVVLIYQFAGQGALNAGPVVSTSCGWMLGLAIMAWVKRKDTGTAWAVRLLSLWFIPVVLFFALAGLNAALKLRLSLGILLTLYLALLVIVFLIARRILGRMMTGFVLPQPEMDERGVKHMVWSGFIGFGALSTLLIAALLQPWISYSDPRLWLGVLSAGMASWFLSLMAFSIVK